MEFPVLFISGNWQYQTSIWNWIMNRVWIQWKLPIFNNTYSLNTHSFVSQSVWPRQTFFRGDSKKVSGILTLPFGTLWYIVLRFGTLWYFLVYCARSMLDPCWPEESIRHPHLASLSHCQVPGSPNIFATSIRDLINMRYFWEAAKVQNGGKAIAIL